MTDKLIEAMFAFHAITMREHREMVTINSADLIVATQEANSIWMELARDAQTFSPSPQTDVTVVQQIVQEEIRLYREMDNADHVSQAKCQT